MRCNYDDWTTKAPKKLNEYHLAVLHVMSDGKVRGRCDMLRAAKQDPTPRNGDGFPGWNKIDYDLYKKGLLVCTRIDSTGQKYFKISAAGKRLISA